MNERQPARKTPAAQQEERSRERTASSVQARPQGVRTAQRPPASSAAKERVARAWGRHPLVAMVRHRRRMSFFVGLHSMLKAGVPLPIAFADLSRGADTDPFRRAVAQVGAAIAQGAGLAEAMRRHPVWFEPPVVAAVEAAEVSGTLEAALAGVIERLEELQKLRWRTLSLCLYPSYLLLAFLIGGAFLDGARDAQSLNTFSLSLTGSLFARVVKVALIAAAAFSFPLGLAALGLEERWAELRVHVPLLGGFYRRTHASRFCQVLGSSLGAGLDAARSLHMALDATGNAKLQARAGAAVHRLRGGASLTDVVEWLDVLDGESLRQVATAERTGHLAPLLQQEAKSQAESGLRLLQVWVVVCIAVLVGFLLLSNVVRIFEGQQEYYRTLENLDRR